MAARELTYDCSIAKELPNGTVRYWTEDQWRNALGDAYVGLVQHDPCYRGQRKKHLHAAGKGLWLLVKAIAFLTWHVLRITWKVFWVLFFVFCFQSLFGRAISKI